MATFDQLVADMTATRAALTAAQTTTKTARAPWDAALRALRIGHPSAGRATPAPTPAPDGPTLGALGLALSFAIAAENSAQTAYNIARRAHADALAQAGA